MPGIVVGVDGSEPSQQALEWAVKEASLRGTSLTVLAVHQVASNHWTRAPETYPADQPEAEKMREAAQELISASGDADLVVVGSRGGGGFARLMLGSTSNQVVNHAACPVVVIPAGR